VSDHQRVGGVQQKFAFGLCREMDKNYAKMARKKFEAGETWNNPELCLRVRESLRDQYIKWVVEKCEHYQRDSAMLDTLLK